MDEYQYRRVRSLMQEYATDEAHVFDIDGTLIEDNLLTRATVSLSREIGKTPLATLSHEDYPEIAVKAGLGKPMDLEGALSAMAVELADHDFFVGVPVALVKELQFISLGRILNSCYQFPRALLLAMRRAEPRRLLIGITGALQEIADVVCAPLGLDIAIGTDHPKHNGVYVKGTKDLRAGMDKGAVMDELTERCGINWGRAVALGDRRYDLSMFEKVRYPIAINPKPRLQKAIRERRDEKWHQGRIAWVDQAVHDEAMEFNAWLPDDNGRLAQAYYLDDILPMQTANAIEGAAGRLKHYAF